MPLGAKLPRHHSTHSRYPGTAGTRAQQGKRTVKEGHREVGRKEKRAEGGKEESRNSCGGASVCQVPHREHGETEARFPRALSNLSRVIVSERKSPSPSNINAVISQGKGKKKRKEKENASEGGDSQGPS